MLTKDQYATAMRDLAAVERYVRSAMDGLDRHRPEQVRVWDRLDLAVVRARNLAMYLTLGTEREEKAE